MIPVRRSLPYDELTGPSKVFGEWLQRIFARRSFYLFGALCVVVMAIMLFPILVSLSASLKTSVEASAGAVQAGVIISILPCLLIYLLLQKYYVSGFLNGAIK